MKIRFDFSEVRASSSATSGPNTSLSAAASYGQMKEQLLETDFKASGPSPDLQVFHNNVRIIPEKIDKIEVHGHYSTLDLTLLFEPRRRRFEGSRVPLKHCVVLVGCNLTDEEYSNSISVDVTLKFARNSR